jgi:hypothetical protein
VRGSESVEESILGEWRLKVFFVCKGRDRIYGSEPRGVAERHPFLVLLSFMGARPKSPGSALRERVLAHL